MAETRDLRTQLLALCERYKIAALYAFGSRAEEIGGAAERGTVVTRSDSDVDIGVRPVPGHHLSVRDRVKLAMGLEDLLEAGRVDLVILPEADPFLSAEIIRGERLYARDGYEADEYDLYVLRRAGDLIPLERERMALILGERQ